tara:strand:+ start:4379 stop:4552 length:174 start_codon:yes stop_codon:yes gene_type:complete
MRDHRDRTYGVAEKNFKSVNGDVRVITVVLYAFARCRSRMSAGSLIAGKPVFKVRDG